MLSKLAAQESQARRPDSICCCLGSRSGRVAVAVMAAPRLAGEAGAARNLLAWLIPSWMCSTGVTSCRITCCRFNPAIAILTVGALERRVLSRSWLDAGVGLVVAFRRWHRSSSSWWRSRSRATGVSCLAVRRGALIFGLFAWWLYDDSRAERSLLNAFVAAIFLAFVIYGAALPALAPLFPSAEIAARAAQRGSASPKAAAAGFQEPSLVFMTDTSTLLTDGSRGADFLSRAVAASR